MFGADAEDGIDPPREDVPTHSYIRRVEKEESRRMVIEISIRVILDYTNSLRKLRLNRVLHGEVRRGPTESRS